MNRRITSAILLLTVGLPLALLAPGLVGGPAAAQEDGGTFGAPMKLGVVDIGDIFKSYVRAKKLETLINEEKKGLEKAIEEQRDKIIKLRKDSEFFTGERLQDSEDELSIEVARLRLMKQRAEVTLKKRFDEYTTRVLSEIEEVVSEYGAKHKYTLILKVDSKKWGEDRLQAALRSVLYHSEQVDITKTVLTILNSPDWLKKMEKRDAEGPALGEGEAGGG